MEFAPFDIHLSPDAQSGESSQFNMLPGERVVRELTIRGPMKVFEEIQETVRRVIDLANKATRSPAGKPHQKPPEPVDQARCLEIVITQMLIHGGFGLRPPTIRDISSKLNLGAYHSFEIDDSSKGIRFKDIQGRLVLEIDGVLIDERGNLLLIDVKNLHMDKKQSRAQKGRQRLFEDRNSPNNQDKAALGQARLDAIKEIFKHAPGYVMFLNTDDASYKAIMNDTRTDGAKNIGIAFGRLPFEPSVLEDLIPYSS